MNFKAKRFAALNCYRWVNLCLCKRCLSWWSGFRFGLSRWSCAILLQVCACLFCDRCPSLRRLAWQSCLRDLCCGSSWCWGILLRRSLIKHWSLIGSSRLLFRASLVLALADGRLLALFHFSFSLLLSSASFLCSFSLLLFVYKHVIY